jgi:TatD DNase family protein
VGLFDVHAHLTSPRFHGEVDAVLSRARDAGVTTIISNGLNQDDNERVLALAERSELVQPALGLYPVDAVLPEMMRAGVDYPREDAVVRPAEESLEFIRTRLDRAVAIGEIGLDHHWVPEPFWERQEAIFRQLVALAMKADLPIIIHTRKAERRTFEILQEMAAPRVNWHCYSSRLKLGRQIAEAGHYLSIPANARRNETFRGLLRGADRRQLLLETDCPYLAPTPGERNEPKNVSETVQLTAELWGVEEKVVLSQLEDNFERLFRFRP